MRRQDRVPQREQRVVRGRRFLFKYVQRRAGDAPGCEALRERKHAASNGVLVVSFALDKRGKIVSDIDVRGIGLPGDDDRPLGDILDEMAERVENAVRALKGEALEDEIIIEQAVSRTLKKASQQIWDRRPIVETVVLRL